ncbi:patatin-like phospholipase family protein [Hyphomicrobiales bacterium]|uniref:patatin-like phospholipase family protein n=1 Tax=Ensifer sp. R-19 TaxID=3404055 RepID=UPI0013AFEB82
MTDTPFRYAAPSDECDLIMKGGITSGVVFPRAITELATRYRFMHIGGTSAGAIAAVMTAAAEYRRQSAATADEKNAGFALIDAMPKELAANLPTFFQPSAETAPLFRVGMAMVRTQGSKVAAAGLEALRVFHLALLLAALPGLALIVAGIAATDWALGILGALVVLIGAMAMLTYQLYRAVAVVLPAHDFGLCSGLTQPGAKKPAFTNWIAERIEAIAGPVRPDGEARPLTIGDLDRFEITLKSVTTDLSSRRPYELPFGDRVHNYRKSEFERLFPPSTMSYLLKESKPRDIVGPDGVRDFYQLPPAKKLPVAIIARMSLSFPGLIRGVPLYRYDYSLRAAARRDPSTHIRCLFSDGGITSNFPIHLFDGLLPGRPTFGISLASYDPRRHGEDEDGSGGSRVHLPRRTAEGKATPVYPVEGLFAFVGAILDTARNWQDTLQSQLHGYSERIVEVRLDDAKEGGLNLDMDGETVNFLSMLGGKAGDVVLKNFDFNEHRWRRAMTMLPTLSESLRKLSNRYMEPATERRIDYPAILTEYDPTGLVGVTKADRLALNELTQKLAAIGAELDRRPIPPPSSQKVDLRITASMDTNPRGTNPPRPDTPPAPNQ